MAGFQWDQFPPFSKLLREHIGHYYAYSIEAANTKKHREFTKNLVLKVREMATSQGKETLIQ